MLSSGSRSAIRVWAASHGSQVRSTNNHRFRQAQCQTTNLNVSWKNVRPFFTSITVEGAHKAAKRREKQNKRYLKEREQDVRKRTDEMRDTFRPGSRLAQQASRRSNDTEGEEEDYIDHSQIGRGRPGNVVPGASDPELDLLKKRKPINFNQKFASAPKINIPTPTRGDSQLDSKINLAVETEVKRHQEMHKAVNAGRVTKEVVEEEAKEFAEAKLARERALFAHLTHSKPKTPDNQPQALRTPRRLDTAANARRAIEAEEPTHSLSEKDILQRQLARRGTGAPSRGPNSSMYIPTSKEDDLDDVDDDEEEENVEVRQLREEEEANAIAYHQVDTSSANPNLVMAGATECCPNFIQATRKRHLGCLDKLIAAQTGQKARGETKMHIAAVLDDLECMKAIVNEANRDSNIINVVNRSGSNPFHIACVRGNLKMMDYLYTRGADLERPDDLGNTPLQLVLSSPSPFEAAKFLLERGASVNQIDNNKVTALHIAAEDSPPEVVQLLLKHKANVFARTAEAETPLWIAAGANNVEALKVLLPLSIDVINDTDDAGQTPLLIASMEECTESVEALLDAGADSSIPDVERMTPLHRAAIFGHAEIVRLLLTKGKALANVLDSRDWSPLYVAAESGSLETVQILLDHGARIDITNSEGRTPLLHAISCGHIEIAQLLIDRGADINRADSNGYTPLLEAIGEIFPEFAMTLIQRGADIDFPTTDFMTPLHLALQEQMFDVAEELVRRGANVKTQTIEGFTAMHFATAAGSEKWVDKLLAVGLDINVMTDEGITPLKIAADHDAEFEQFMRSRGARDIDLFYLMEKDEQVNSTGESSATVAASQSSAMNKRIMQT